MSSLIVLHGVRTIQLTKGLNTLIDEADEEELSRRSWFAVPSSRKNSPDRKYWYAKAGIRVAGKAKQLSLHRVLLNAAEGMEVDHRNGDSLDNRRANLRLCTTTENRRNTHISWGRSKYKGVFQSKSPQRWMAHIVLANGHRKHLGRFPDEQSAARAYDEAAIREYGEFACTNAEMFGDL